MRIKFYSENRPAGVIADFVVTLLAPWGEQWVCGSIIESARDKEWRVLWPKQSAKFFATCPGSIEHTREAEKMILRQYEQWRSKK